MTEKCLTEDGNRVSSYQQTGLVGFFVYWHINACELFNAKAILLEEQ